MTGLERRVILKALDRPEVLTEWEYDFINGLADKDESYELSEKQSKMLLWQIWPKVSG